PAPVPVVASPQPTVARSATPTVVAVAPQPVPAVAFAASAPVAQQVAAPFAPATQTSVTRGRPPTSVQRPAAVAQSQRPPGTFASEPLGSTMSRAELDASIKLHKKNAYVFWGVALIGTTGMA